MTTTDPDVRTESTEAPAAKPKRGRRGGSIWRSIGPVAAFVLLLVVVSIFSPAFITGNGLVIIATQSAAILFVALGQSMVLHVGSIDLSNAAIGLFAAILLALLLGPLGPAAVIISLIVATLIGLANGALFALTQVPSFALTLGTLGILAAASLVLSRATTVYVKANSEVLAWLFNVGVANIPSAFVVGIVVAIILWAFLRFTRTGQNMTAVGHNEKGAIFAGVRNRRIKMLAFALSGLLAGLAGVVIIAQAGSASTSGLGSDLLLPGIAAAIVGGTAITGGISNPITVVFGSLTVALLPIAASAVGVNAQAQSLAYGLVIILIVAVTSRGSRTAIVK